MNDVRKIDLKKAPEWLAGEVEIRVPRAWLVIGATAVLVLSFIAFD